MIWILLDKKDEFEDIVECLSEDKILFWKGTKIFVEIASLLIGYDFRTYKDTIDFLEWCNLENYYEIKEIGELKQL